MTQAPAQRSGGDGLLNAADSAWYLKVAPATIRGYRRRGLLQPRGGTDRRPLYHVLDLDRVRRQIAENIARTTQTKPEPDREMS